MAAEPASEAISAGEASVWLERYGAAWETGDAEAVAALFSEDASYRETPFDAPMRGRDAIRRYWREGAGDAQRDVSFSFELWAVTGSLCFSRWSARFVRVATGEPVELDGVFRLEFARSADGAPLCRLLEEWWHRR